MITTTFNVAQAPAVAQQRFVSALQSTQFSSAPAKWTQSISAPCESYELPKLMEHLARSFPKDRGRTPNPIVGRALSVTDENWAMHSFRISRFSRPVYGNYPSFRLTVELPPNIKSYGPVEVLVSFDKKNGLMRITPKRFAKPTPGSPARELQQVYEPYLQLLVSALAKGKASVVAA